MKFYHVLEVTEAENFEHGVDSIAGDVLIFIHNNELCFLEDDGDTNCFSNTDEGYNGWIARIRGLMRWKKAWKLV